MEDNKSARVVAKKSKGKQTLSTFIKGLLRRGSFHWRARTEAMTAARVERGRYKCNSCSELFGPKEVDLDHIVPVVDPKTGFTTWDDYISRLFCEADGFAVICKQCHSNKTAIEDAMREHYKTQRDQIPDLTPDKKYSKKKKPEEPVEN
jgi:5-methylcytosine-specific restriction endonuclease McrA